MLSTGKAVELQLAFAMSPLGKPAHNSDGNFAVCLLARMRILPDNMKFYGVRFFDYSNGRESWRGVEADGDEV
jgi:hypothetical protein